ncbi:MAG: hypothetical protein QXR87_05265 [Candidatus Hadarchaeales archaeon]
MMYDTRIVLEWGRNLGDGKTWVAELDEKGKIIGFKGHKYKGDRDHGWRIYRVIEGEELLLHGCRNGKVMLQKIRVEADGIKILGTWVEGKRVEGEQEPIFSELPWEAEEMRDECFGGREWGTGNKFWDWYWGFAPAEGSE